MEPNREQGLHADDPGEILTTFRSRQWETDGERRPWLIAIVVVASCFIAGYLWLESGREVAAPVAATTTAENPIPKPRAVIQVPMASDEVAPTYPAGKTRVYECRQDGQRILSDRPCGLDAVEREVDVGALNTFSEVAPVSDNRPASSPIPTTGRVSSPARTVAGSDKKRLCEQLQARIDYINARTRQKHTSRESDYWRAEWHKAKNAYYDADCGR